MTFDTGQFVLALTMIDSNITMGNESSVPDLGYFPGMTDTAAVAAYGILAGKDPERSPLVGLFCQYRF